MNLDGKSDLIDPADEDWTALDAAAVWWAARDGVPQAKAEMARRNRQAADGTSTYTKAMTKARQLVKGGK